MADERRIADLSIPIVAVTLLHRKGYFFQISEEESQEQKSDIRDRIKEAG